MAVSKSFLKITWLLILLASAVAAGLCFLIPVAPTVKDPFMAHMRTSFAMVLSVLYMGSAFWFFGGLKHFKNQLRVAFVLLGSGFIIFSIAMLQLPIFGLFDLWQTAWATGGGVILIFMFAAFLMYLAMRQFASTLKFQSTESFGFIPFALLIVLGFTVVSYLAGKFLIQYQLDGVDIYIAAVGATMGFFFCSYFLARRIGKLIGPAYKQEIRWQEISFFALFIGAAHEAITTLFLTTGSPYEDYGVYLWPFVVCGFIILRASYEFRLLTSAVAPEVKVSSGTELTAQDYIDSIISLGKLASRPADIEPILADMHLVPQTAPNQKLPFADRVTLFNIYKKLESYLVKDDPLRKFSIDDLRKLASPRFKTILDESK